jgi:hypothetical protein
MKGFQPWPDGYASARLEFYAGYIFSIDMNALEQKYLT